MQLRSTFSNRLGAEAAWTPRVLLALLSGCLLLAALISLLGGSKGLAAALLPALALGLGMLLRYPGSGIFVALFFSFISSGLGLYFPSAPWGLSVDFILLLCVICMIFLKFRSPDWHRLSNDGMLWAALWLGYLLLELFNPESPGPVAWGYAVRGIGLYNVFVFALAFMYLRRATQAVRFVHWVLALSVLGALWGFKQRFIGLDAAEHYWLYELEHHQEHLLHGVLRVFSFYSDAGQFGASQAMVALMCGILTLGPFSWQRRLLYAAIGLITFFGFLYSGTRGALAVPAAGLLLYLLLSKNFKLFFAGLLFMGLVFYALKYTYVLQSYQPVARMRTALSADDPSLQARLRNQITFGEYLRNRPMGGGVGSAGFWGERFRPGSLLAKTPTDSYYVKIWAETGILGICLHFFILGYFLGKSSYIVWHLRRPQLKYYMLALLAAFGGVMLASYGNQVYSQFPTGIIMAIALPLIFMAPQYDDMLEKETT
jgi:hypothetical protein